MDNIVLISQNVILPSLERIKPILEGETEITFLSTQFLFENERELIKHLFGVECSFLTFSDLLSDSERGECDNDAFCPSRQGQNVLAYYDEIKKLKNERIVAKLLGKGSYKNKIIVSDDLGIYKPAWIDKGFVPVTCEYYYTPVETESRPIVELIKQCLSPIRKVRRALKTQIFVAHKDGVKYLFYGSLNRIAYRVSLDFKRASIIENIRYVLNNWGFVLPNTTVRLSTFHEGYHILNDKKALNVKLIQDGYLPPNYSSKYLLFYGHYTEFYTWDRIGCNTMIFHKLPHRIMPFRKKLYLPEPVYPQKIKRVLCVASGAGDWTAVKNRSDEDKMLWAFGKVAKLFPTIEFVYRCHPVWIHPSHQGVNSINRATEYIHWLNLPNFRLSGNIPNAIQDGKFCLSYKRSSLEEDLQGVDIVFGEHSIAMIDAAFKGILFGSCNVTGHRDFFEDITKLGFPHCESVEGIAALIESTITPAFKETYDAAIKNYNQMTDEE